MVGCSGDDGDDGATGAAGSNGLSCWDLNQNGVPDFPDEDTNDDGVIDVNDCQLPPPSIGDAETLHKAYFTDSAYEDTQSCLNCHGPIGDDVITTAHFTWEGLTTTIAGFENEFHGKNDIINNFCVAVPTNEGRCAQCHIGIGYADDTFDFTNPKNVDCLVCHDQTGTYAKAPTTAGAPEPAVDLQAVAQSIAENDGVPTRKACLFCHAQAGGGNNVKHGDLALSLADTTAEFDVHMGTDGGNRVCVDCHAVKKDADDNVLSHGIGGMVFHSTDEGDMKDCGDCHGDRTNIHAGSSVEQIIGLHPRIACQTCHIPTFARNYPTKVEWYWEDAGDVARGVETEIVDGAEVPVYDPKKGSFVWQSNVRPTLLFYDGRWEKFMVEANDQYTSLPAVLAAPATDYTNPDAMIYPFKKMIGNQVADANNNTILVPHLFGSKGGPNAYWSKYDWDLALQDGAAYTGQTYSGAYEFVDTVMYLTVNHEVAPKEEAWGMDNMCVDCHADNAIDWQALGWTGNPITGGTRP
jgi:octaheme c-type cytochrome (tetrathionate reductase family)